MNKRSGMQHIDSKITNLLKPVFKNDKRKFIAINNLFKNWNSIIGNKYHNYCSPKSIKNEGKDNTLFIYAHNSSIGFIIENNSEIILEKIASLYGYKPINKIKVIISPKNIKIKEVSKNKVTEEINNELITKNLSSINDLELAETLANLWHAIKSSDKKSV